MDGIINENEEVLMEKCKLVIVSDAHNYIEGFDQVFEQDPDADYYLDLGDNFCYNEPTKDFLSRWCSVRGNNDYYSFPKSRNFTIFNKNIRMLHGENMFWVYNTFDEIIDYMKMEDVDVLLMGHTHRRAYVEKENRIIINPGSIGRTREYDMYEQGLGTYCVLTIYEDGKIEHEFKTIERH